MSRPHRTVLFAPLLSLIPVACAESPEAPAPPGHSDSGAPAEADTGDPGGDGEAGGCPSGALARLVWADRDLTHALMPGFALSVVPEVTAVVETQATLEILQRFDRGRFTSVTLTALEGEDRRPLFEDRLLWGEDGLPEGEQRWVPDGAAGWVLEAASTFRHDAAGRRLEATLEFAAGGPAQRLLWTWEEGCLVAYDRAADDGRPGSLLTCTAGDRVQGLVADDGSPPRRFRWPAAPRRRPARMDSMKMKALASSSQRSGPGMTRAACARFAAPTAPRSAWTPTPTAA